jgi:hypothetical protein
MPKKRKQRNVTTIKTLSRQDQPFVTIVLICDKPAHRMKSYGPTPLIELNKKKQKLIDQQIEIIKHAFENFEIIMCCGSDSYKIANYIYKKHSDINIRIIENQIYQQSNSCESLRICLNNTGNDNVLVISGYTKINKGLFRNFIFNESHVIATKIFAKGFDVGLNVNKLDHAEHFSFGATLCWLETLFLRGDTIIQNLMKIISQEEYKKKFIFESLNALIQDNNKIKTKIISNKRILKIDNISIYNSLIKDKNHEICYR